MFLLLEHNTALILSALWNVEFTVNKLNMDIYIHALIFFLSKRHGKIAVIANALWYD